MFPASNQELQFEHIPVEDLSLRQVLNSKGNLRDALQVNFVLWF